MLEVWSCTDKRLHHTGKRTVLPPRAGCDRIVCVARRKRLGPVLLRQQRAMATNNFLQGLAIYNKLESAAGGIPRKELRCLSYIVT